MISLPIILVIVYFLVCIVIGFLSRRDQNSEGFFLANRKLNVFQSTATISAGFIGVSILMLITGFIYLYGISASWMFVGILVGFIIFSRFGVFLKRKSKKRYYTLSDYFKDRLGSKIAIMATFAVIMVYISVVINQFIGGGKILEYITGWPYNLSLILMGAVVLFYLLLGGFRSVVKTDVLQFLIMILLPILFIFSITQGISLPPEYFNLFNVGPLYMVSFFFVGIFNSYIYAELWQRVYAAKNEKTVKRSFVLSGVVILVFGAMMTYIALVTRTVFTSIDPDLAGVYGLSNFVPVGLMGLTVVFLFALLMSSIDTSLFVLSMNFSRDIMNRKRKLGKRKEVRYTRLALVGFVTLAILVAIFYPSMLNVVIIYLSLGLPLSPLIIVSWLSKKPNVRAMIVSFITADLFVIGFLAITKIVHPGMGLASITLSAVVYFATFKFIKNKQER